MTSIEYNDLVECLYRGHDVEFSFGEQHYFLERDNTCHNLYKVSEDLEDAEFLKKIDGENLIVRVNAFFRNSAVRGEIF